MQSRVLIVDDDHDAGEVLGDILSADGHRCEVVHDGAAALRRVEGEPFDLVLSDVVMDGMSGLELLDRVRVSQPALPVVLVTAVGAVPQATDAIRRGAFHYLVKPCDSSGLRRVVREALGARKPVESAKARPPASARAPADFIGSGRVFRDLQTTIDFVARSSAPVLVTGETGSGKELVARAIHERSARREGPFVAVNTAAIPHELLEGELFGHVRGAFTGAAQGRKGLITEADGGTLLLDEIGEMSLGLQSKLLRVLQSSEVRPVGGNRSHHVDVRVVASTHRDLAALVEEGRFREDLYFRLHVLPVFVPPLRSRCEDIPALATHFLAGALRRAPGSPVRSIGADAMRLLTDRPWPGNVRELASCIERAVVFGVDEVIEARHLAAVLDARAPADTSTWPCPVSAPWTLRRLSRAYADWAIEQAHGNKERAAETLGVDLSTLYRWLRARKD